jgi:hypothetical protein
MVMLQHPRGYTICQGVGKMNYRAGNRWIPKSVPSNTTYSSSEYKHNTDVLSNSVSFTFLLVSFDPTDFLAMLI